jgi:hypothetical protein
MVDPKRPIDWSSKARAEEGSMSQKLSEQGLAVYKLMLDEMGFLKKQQWTITNYLVAIYAAIFWLSRDFRPTTHAERCSLTILVIVAGVFGVALLVQIQYDLGKARLRIQSADDIIFDPQERTALGIELYRGPHRRGLSFLLALIGVSVIGPILLIWSLWR